MRIVYCHSCGAVSTNTFGENDVCTSCGSHAERMDYHRPWQYWASSAILLAAAVVFVWAPLDVTARAVIFIGVLIVSVMLSNWGMQNTRRRVLAEVARRKAAEEKA